MVVVKDRGRGQSVETVPLADKWGANECSENWGSGLRGRVTQGLALGPGNP